MSTSEATLDSAATALTGPEVHLATPAASVLAVVPARPETTIRWRAGFKRAFDIALSLLSLLVLAPLFLIIALAIKLTDPGPVFYRHRRLTLGGRPLDILKFRTMHAKFSTGERFGGRTDADVFAELGQAELAQEFGERQKLRHDPRITRVGAWLRRTSLDELPQLWNVLRGDMSAIGPRPIVEDELEKYGDACDLVLSFKPGLTGLWQVSGRSELSYEDRVRLDLEYVTNWRALLDLKIICRTLPAVLTGRGAY